LKEVLALPAIAGKIKDTKAAREVSALQDFYAMLTADSSRAFYGPGHVLAAAELGAIQTLLISGARPCCCTKYGAQICHTLRVGDSGPRG
jgi:stalled ribosome rescue protein Dom34